MTNHTVDSSSAAHADASAVSAQTATPELPPTAEPVVANSDVPTDAPAAAEAPAYGDRETTPKQRRRHAKSKSKKRRRHASVATKSRGGAASHNHPLSLAESLLARLALPDVTLDRRLFPAPLLAALDAAGLGAPDLLPSAVFLSLAAVGAVARSNVQCMYADGIDDTTSGNASLRVALLTASRRSPLVPASILSGVYAVENIALDEYDKMFRLHGELRRAADQRRRLHEQTVRTAAILGLPMPPPLPDAAIIGPGPRPRIVVADGAGSAIRKAAAGGTGSFVLDQRRLSWMADVGDFYDAPTDELLNAVAAGHQIPIPDPVSGRTIMRRFTASAAGVLCIAEFPTLSHAGPPALIGTVFVPAKPPREIGDSTALDALMLRVHEMTRGNVTFRLPTEALASSSAAWTEQAQQNLPPLSAYLAALPDLARRLAVLLHLTAAAGNDGGSPSRDISLSTVKHALAIVDQCVLPAARSVLGPVSITEPERNARRLIQHLRATTSAERPIFDRRSVMRAWQHSMKVPQLDAAIGLLQEAALLVASGEVDGKKRGGQQFEIAASMYD